MVILASYKDNYTKQQQQQQQTNQWVSTTVQFNLVIQTITLKFKNFTCK